MTSGSHRDNVAHLEDAPTVRSRLFRKYVALFGVVVALAFVGGLTEIWFSYWDHRAAIMRIEQEQSNAAAEKIGQFVAEIERQVGWTTLLPWTSATPEQRYLDAERLLRQVPAVMELTQLDADGREQLRVSRMTIDAIGRGLDFSHEPQFTEAVARGVYHGPVYFRRESEPYMTLSLAGTQREAGVSVVEVNLKLIWEVISKIKVGEHGDAFVIDKNGTLIAHPDISLVLRKTDMARLPQVRSALDVQADQPADEVQVATDINGRQVLAAHSLVPSLGWLVFVETSTDEAYAPLYLSIERTGLVLLGALALSILGSMLLARQMVVPIQALCAGAARIGRGELGQRISISTGDELEALSDQFNSMAAQLQDSYSTLERKVQDRTHQLEAANAAKSRFLAAASHDLRQPLHALGLFVAELPSAPGAAERQRIVERIDAAVNEMNELFNELLDVSKLDAGVLAPNLSAFPVARLLKRIESTFAQLALAKGLRLRIVANSAWVHSDPILLERILLNLVSNAVRYTASGTVVVGCRHRGQTLRIEVCDSGPGIPEEQHQKIFDEFYQLPDPKQEAHSGLGLGLAIVDRLCRLLGHELELSSAVGRGSRFAIVVPRVAPRIEAAKLAAAPEPIADPLRGRLVVVVDDDALALEGMLGLMLKWGCRVLASRSYHAALAELAKQEQKPDVIIADYHLSEGKSGIEVIDNLRLAFGVQLPALLISGDVSPERLRSAAASGFQLLHKPVSPLKLRAAVAHLLKPQSSISAPTVELAS
jgi:signal transduction histidine kinase/CheY-like chemotaxis protein